MSNVTTDNLEIPLIGGEDFVSKEGINNALKQIDSNAVNKKHIDTKLHWGRWKPSTSFDLREVIRVEDCPSWGYLECTKAGITGTAEPTGFYGEGDTRTDGEVQWTLRRLVNSATISVNADQVKYTTPKGSLSTSLTVKDALDKASTDFLPRSEIKDIRAFILIGSNACTRYPWAGHITQMLVSYSDERDTDISFWVEKQSKTDFQAGANTWQKLGGQMYNLSINTSFLQVDLSIDVNAGDMIRLSTTDTDMNITVQLLIENKNIYWEAE